MGVSGAVGASSSTATMIVDSDEEQGGAAGKIAAKMPLDNMDTQLYVPDTQIVMAPLAAEELLLSQEAPKQETQQPPRRCPADTTPSLEPACVGPADPPTTKTPAPDSLHVNLSPEKEARKC